LEYEDERLRDHAIELITALTKDLGVEEEGDEEEWQDESSESEGDDLEAMDGDGDAEMT